LYRIVKPDIKTYFFPDMMNFIQKKASSLTLEKLKFEFSKNQFHTQNKTGVSITKSKMLMLYRDIITVYYGKYEVHTYFKQHASLVFR